MADDDELLLPVVESPLLPKIESVTLLPKNSNIVKFRQTKLFVFFFQTPFVLYFNGGLVWTNKKKKERMNDVPCKKKCYTIILCVVGLL